MGSQRKIWVAGETTVMGLEMYAHLRSRYGSCALVDNPGEHLVQEDTAMPESTARAEHLYRTIVQHSVTEVYLLSPIMRATPTGVTMRAWHTGMDRLLNLLEIARQEPIRIFWSYHTGAHTDAVRAGANQVALQWCSHYRERYGVDVRSLGFPSLVSWRQGTDHLTCGPARAMFTAAVSKQAYECPLPVQTNLSLLYMPDAARAAIALMEAEETAGKEQPELRGMRITPAELAATIRRFCPEFSMVSISDGSNVNESPAERPAAAAAKLSKSGPRFTFRPSWDLLSMTNDMLVKIEQQVESGGHPAGWQLKSATG